ncbi:FecCD family ABC transporter permease [Actinotignum timonense]|uniref:FecCD family ABC transporter permease n=1 Tax=Actinotignum timonense TaxID=1870995 RepID=UPI002A832117|nr:iron chelate uptake ABC transporter family permease subunit [Actinotignum timonense]MDY5158013.1 iron chelate uptake ABC transporter family permease subunit [Actinotignum timonense]
MSTPPQPAAQQLAAPHTGAAPQSVPAAPELSSVAPVTARPQRSRSTAARRRRSRLVAAVVSLALVVGCLGALLLGDLPLTPAEVAACFSPDSMRAVAAGQGDFAAQVVLTWRLPRILAAVAFGAALGLSGALFQILTRNPLGSPDIIGFNAGAYTGVILTRTFLVGGALAVSMGALAGGVVVGIIIYALAYRNGVSGFRLIIVGIGMTAMLSAANTWLLLRASDEVALSMGALAGEYLA